MKLLALLISLILMFAGCTHDRFGITSDAKRISERHPFVADVTCISATSRPYTALRDEFHLKAMPPRIRWTAEFRIDHLVKGDCATPSFRITDALDSGARFSKSGFWFQTNASYRVGFDRITDGEVRGLEVLTERKGFLPNPSDSATFRAAQLHTDIRDPEIRPVVYRLTRLKPGMTKQQVWNILGRLPLEDKVIWISAGSDWGEGCDSYLLRHGYSLRLLWEQTDYDNWRYRRAWLEHNNRDKIEF